MVSATNVSFPCAREGLGMTALTPSSYACSVKAASRVAVSWMVQMRGYFSICCRRRVVISSAEKFVSAWSGASKTRSGRLFLARAWAMIGARFCSSLVAKTGIPACLQTVVTACLKSSSELKKSRDWAGPAGGGASPPPAQRPTSCRGTRPVLPVSPGQGPLRFRRVSAGGSCWDRALPAPRTPRVFFSPAGQDRPGRGRPPKGPGSLRPGRRPVQRHRLPAYPLPSVRRHASSRRKCAAHPSGLPAYRR